MDERQVGALRFQLDLSQPIYEQIVEQMSRAILRGDIGLGEKIPSVRELAQGLRVTPNTVMHAYQEMERQGLTETRRGQGTFITSSRQRVEAFRQQEAHRVVTEFLAKMRSLGFTEAEIIEQLRSRRQEEEMQ
ncbi:GntR family transcriptional regulator [Alicyclobacillus contaminans]|uniref:GntR family transcriptional regulator n=1 Tax=Alicyclobacillus contaminans TaxID=392016 RepID=UPI00041CE8A5|nr:GntR family transcriptional regulator [Alicyclobacillus contaminans]GMA51923.1 GntR family transcriptional regulator [Alicyclobacillus contaminans]